MTAWINETSYVAQFSDDQKRLIIHICDTNRHLYNLHSINDHDTLMAIAHCAVIYDLFMNPYDQLLEREDLVDDCLVYYVNAYQILLAENRIMDAGLGDDDLDAMYTHDIYLCQTIIDQLRQKTTDRLSRLTTDFQ